MGNWSGVCATVGNYCQYDVVVMDDAVYLKITPETFRLEQEQMFMLQNCQFCGSHKLNYSKLNDTRNTQTYWTNFCSRNGLPHSKLGRNILWRTHCPSCKKTNAVILEPHKDKILG